MLNFKILPLLMLSMFVLFPLTTQAEGYRTSIGEGPDEISVVVVKGTPYEMGFAFGELMKDEIKETIGGYLGGAQMMSPERCGDEVLDAAWESIKPHTNPRYEEEMHGLADGADIPFEKILRGHMIPVTNNYSCSGVGVWGDMSEDGHCYLIRNLDYTTDGGLQDNPVVVVYFPDNGIPHANITFAGVIGCNSGMNAEGIALSEKGASPDKDYPFDLNGTHFLSLFRDILYDASNMDEALAAVTEAKLIKKYRFYFGDGKNNKAVKIKSFAPDPPIIWGDNDPSDEVAPNIMPNVIYYTMDNDLAFNLLRTYKGKINAERMIHLSKSVASDNGNLLNIVYDTTDLKAWIAYAEGGQDASTQNYVEFNLNDYMPYNTEGQASVVTVSEGDAGSNADGNNNMMLIILIGILVVVAAFTFLRKKSA